MNGRILESEGPQVTSDQFDKPVRRKDGMRRHAPASHMDAEQIRAAAEALLESLYREYPEGLPFYCRTQAENLDRALHPEIYSE